MRKGLIFFVAVCVAAASCTKDKTDYEAEIETVVPEYTEFKEALLIQHHEYDIRIEALNGTFYKGYNEIRLKVLHPQTGAQVNAAAVTLLPVLTHLQGASSSGPHRHELAYVPDSNYFSGYVVFTEESSAAERWALYIGLTVGSERYSPMKAEITVAEQANKNLNMTAFTGHDGEQYVIALVAPQKPTIAENQLVAGIYQLQAPSDAPSVDVPDPAQFSYAEVRGYTLLLDPRMPEPSMGNHSSPNNKDLVQGADGLYHGVVNYTMTGNWTLNFILLNQHGRILGGTEVPTDFTPGVEGKRSEVHIDILF